MMLSTPIPSLTGFVLFPGLLPARRLNGLDYLMTEFGQRATLG